MVTVEEYRVESDTMGEVKVPNSAYYGAQTQRAVENFPISGIRLPKEFIRAMALVKLAAARANIQLGLLEPKKGEAIVSAAKEVMEGSLYDQFVVDVFQTGSGTSTNMNANEVIANRAVELLWGKRGDKKLVHPNDHVNMCQSTNDVFPTAIHVAVNSQADTSAYNALQKKGVDFIKQAKNLSQFGDRDSDPGFVSNVVEPAIAKWLDNPGSTTSTQSTIESQKSQYFQS